MIDFDFIIEDANLIGCRVSTFGEDLNLDEMVESLEEWELFEQPLPSDWVLAIARHNLIGYLARLLHLG